MNRECNLTKRVETEKGLRYCPVVYSTNGRVKPDARQSGRPRRASREGAYYIDWREGSKRMRRCVGKDAQDAAARRQRKKRTERAQSRRSVAPEIGSSSGPLAAAIVDYLEEIRLSKKPKTYAAYSTALRYFEESCRRRIWKILTRKDLLRFLGIPAR